VPARLRWESGRLAWDPGPGRAAVRYEVHGSDERGFSIREGEEPVFVGNQKTGGLFPGKEFERFPATRVAEVALPPLEFRPTHAFYRVVAVDEKGVRSGASEALAAKRPFLYSEPVTEARAGSPYRYSARSIRSIGDLRCRTVNGDCYSAAFWDAETPRFALEQGPAWLSLDPVSGVLSGTPREADAGEHEVRIRVEIQGMGADLQRFTLRCGR
jgi:hypothetical protein